MFKLRQSYYQWHYTVHSRNHSILTESGRFGFPLIIERLSLSRLRVQSFQQTEHAKQNQKVLSHKYVFNLLISNCAYMQMFHQIVF